MNPAIRIGRHGAQGRLDKRSPGLGFSELIKREAQHVVKVGGLMQARSRWSRQDLLVCLSSGKDFAFRMTSLGKSDRAFDRHGPDRRNSRLYAARSICRECCESGMV